MDIYCTSNKITFTLICFHVLLTGYIARYTALVQYIKCDPIFILFGALYLSTYCTLMGIFNFSLGLSHLNTKLEKDSFGFFF